MRPVRLLACYLMAGLLLAACNEDGSGSASPGAAEPGGSAPPAVTGQPPANRAPVISLSSQTVLVGRELRVRPSASDPDGQSLTFSIANRPSWLAFDSRNGEISGTPTSADVGTYDNIRITVSDGKAQATASFSITVTEVTTGRATLSWNAPTQRTDGAPLTNLAGFRIYYGSNPGDLRYLVEIKDPGARSWVIEDLTSGTWYFSATAFDTAGVESARTNPASKTIA